MLKLPGYKITEEIYRSSNSIVLQGNRIADDAPILIKFGRSSYPSHTDLAKVRREFDIARELDLPGVLRYHSLENHQGALALVMEDFGGKSLADIQAEHPLALDKFLELAASLAGTLGEIHRKGVIHKDIKPQNIVANVGENVVKFIDFGISSRLARESAAAVSPGKLEGTLAYMSPEQTGRMNRAVDYRSDLYSLGVTLYQTLTGKLPFEQTDSMELIHAHIAVAPPPPATMHDGSPVPPALQKIVLKLMAKTAEERYLSAFGLKADLERCLKELREKGAISDFDPGQGDFSDQFQIPQKLYGRETETARLNSYFKKIAGGQRLLLLVRGQSGVGKSALINEIHKPITAKRGIFLSGKFDQFQRDVPYSALIQAFTEHVRQILTEDREEVQNWKDKLVAALGPNGQVIIDVIPEVELIVGEQNPVPELPPTESRNRFNLVFQNFIRVFAEADHPLVVFLDDLQWADAATLQLLTVLLSDPDSHHLMIIGAYRDNEVGDAHPLNLTLEEIRRSDAELAYLNLMALKMQDVYRLIADTLGLPPVNDAVLDEWAAKETRRRSKKSYLDEPEEAGPSADSFASDEDKEAQMKRPPAGWDLAELVFQKTDGNPFFINEFLGNLYKEGLLERDPNTGEWEYDVYEIRGRGISDNIEELLGSRIKELPERCADLLKLAACMGNQFDLRLLAMTLEESGIEAAEQLAPALEAGLLLPLDGDYKYVSNTGAEADWHEINYKFAHDRVQQASYALLDGQERLDNHMRIGRLYLANFSEEEREERILDIVNHLNFSRELLSKDLDRVELARLNLEAGRKAKFSTAYEGAIRLFRIGLDLLPENAVKQHYELFIALNMELGETEYVSGNLKGAEGYFDTVLHSARTGREKIKIYEIKIAVSTGQNQPEEAIELGVEALRMLGMRLPTNPSRALVQAQLLRVRRKLRKLSDEKIRKLAPMKDGVRPETMRLLMQLGMPAYLRSSPLFPLIIARMIKITLRYGLCPESASAFAAYGMLTAGLLGDYETGRRFGRLGLDLVQAMGARELQCRVQFLYASALMHWGDHVKLKDRLLRDAYQSGLETGDLQYVSLSIFQMNSYPLWAGTRNLSEVLGSLEKYNNAIRKTGQVYSIQINDLTWQAALNIQGGSRDRTRLVGDHFDETKISREWQASGNLQGLYYLHFYKVLLAGLFQQNDKLLAHARAAREYQKAVLGSLSEPILEFFYSIALLDGYAELGPKERKAFPAMIEERIARHAAWAQVAPENFSHFSLLVQAEWARVREQHGRAMDLFDAAVSATRTGAFTVFEGYANERAAVYFESINKHRFALLYLKDARRAYDKARFASRVDELEKLHYELAQTREDQLQEERRTRKASAADLTHSTRHATTTTTATTADGAATSGTSLLDMGSVLKASQMLAGELHLDRLLARLMKVVMENAGAQRVALLLEKEGDFRVEARARFGEQAETLQGQPLAETQDLPRSVINFVERTGEPVVLADAAGEGRFNKDEYITAARPRSVLAVPVQLQGKLIGILYMENNSTTGAFTKDRIETLKILSSNIATSIDNARLYQNLERSLEQEKQAKQAQIELNSASSRFVPTAFLQLLEKNSIVDARLGDHIEKEMTVLFSDIRSFTSLSESMTPAENFRFINTYLGKVGPVVREHDGFIDKYIGDAIMALFPTPDDGVLGAIGMLKKLQEYNVERERDGLVAIKTGIGINTGELMLGTIGETDRMEGTVISDTVNLASRMEGLTKFYGASLIISDATFDRLEDPMRYRHRLLDRVQVKGKKDPVKVIEILEGDDEASIERKMKALVRFQEAQSLFLERLFDDAASLFKDIFNDNPEDLAAALYYKRARKLKEIGVPDDWKGVTALSRK